MKTLLHACARLAGAAEEQILNFYSWPECIGEDTVHAFGKETGIHDRHDSSLRGTVGMGYDVEKVTAALGGEPIPANPFELVSNPKSTVRLKAGGISMLDSASDVAPSALSAINFVLRPAVQAEITCQVIVTGPAAGARKFIRREVLDNEIAFPPGRSLLTQAQRHEVCRSETRRVMTRLFTGFKPGLH